MITLTTAAQSQTTQPDDQTKLRAEKAALNSVVGKGDPGTVNKRFQMTLEQALTAAYEDAGLTIPDPPKPEHRWAVRPGQSMTWGSRFFGTAAVEIQTHKLGEVTERGINCWAPIELVGRPNWINFRVMVKLAEGVKCLFTKEGVIVRDVTDPTSEPPLFNVQVDWFEGVPHTRREGDNIDLLLLDNEGTFVQLEIGVVSRNGRFYLTFQEMYAGQVARTTAAKAAQISAKTVTVGDHVGLVAPLYEENNYPGADFLATRGMVHGVVKYAIELGRSKTFSQCKIPKWESVPVTLPEKMASKGWQTATCLWYNLILGWGFAQLGDGSSCFVHMANIIDDAGRTVMSKGEFPVLEPMKMIAIKYKDESGKRKATAIRTL